jgi:phenylpropionate dioxygenase-like ring-hydroxylating dioxygenase large terminal subunit
LVFFRDAEGRARALIDRCPHRGVRLSLGRVSPAGCVECPFHGWRFDGSGQNVHVPFNPAAKRSLLGATAVPVIEQGGLLWVYTAATPDPPEPTVPDAFTDPNITACFVEEEWSCHWTRAMENMLDMPHLPFVHRRTIGRRLSKEMTAQSTMELRWEETSFGARIHDVGKTGGASIEFWRPNIMVLKIPIPGRHFRIHAMCVPAHENRTRMVIVGTRDFARWALFNPLFARSNRKILGEDKAVVESSDPPAVPRAGNERSVATDGPTLEFRKYYFSQLKGESSMGASAVRLSSVSG